LHVQKVVLPIVYTSRHGKPKYKKIRRLCPAVALRDIGSGSILFARDKKKYPKISIF